VSVLDDIWNKTLEWDREAIVFVGCYEKIKKDNPWSLEPFGHLCAHGKAQHLGMLLRHMLYDSGYRPKG